MLINYKNLYKAYLECRKNKRKTVNALKFELNLENNLNMLLEDLKNRKYKTNSSVCFILTEPSVREIFAADFRDRIVHHLFVRELNSMAEKRFIYDSYACRKDKGTHKAVSKLLKFIRLKSKNYKKEIWFMKIDIKSFFINIDLNVLYKLTLNLISKSKKNKKWEEEIVYLAKVIIFSKPANNYRRKGNTDLIKLVPKNKSLIWQKENKGLPIGNYSSQFFANLYLNKLDQYCKKALKIKHYLRYVDDMLILSECKEILKKQRDLINNFLREELSMELNNKKTMIQSVDRGVDFLGYFLKKEKIYPRNSVVSRYKNKLYKVAVTKSFAPYKKIIQINSAFCGHSGFFSSVEGRSLRM